jgi:hypothetical protein
MSRDGEHFFTMVSIFGHLDFLLRKTSVQFITEIEKSTLKVRLETQKTANSRGNTEQKVAML